ncbi:MAG TPA: histone deacetylase family protein [Candidatus Cybelea sp.]|nr:histone deacetylase family protein [Candidatus Cybelea sp.]
MTTAIFTHATCLNHDTGLGHPECADRLRAVLHGLDDKFLAGLQRIEAPRATQEQLLRVHPADFIAAIMEAIPNDGLSHIDGDTIVSPDSGEAALRAAGAVCAAVDAVVEGMLKNAFCAVRPPGHHAEPSRAMGFCLFNNVAIGALHARAVHSLQRIAVVDFDVHHGNGTQAMFEGDAELFYASTHQWPLYPGTGTARERGVAENVLNVPLPPGAGSSQFRQAFERALLPALDRFRPDLVMISAGFDAHQDDPLANLNLQDADYRWATAALCDLAAHRAGGRVVSALEGGYNLDALARSSREHVEALMAA